MYLVDVYENEKNTYYIQYIYQYSCYFMIVIIGGLLLLLMIYSAIKV